MRKDLNTPAPPEKPGDDDFNPPRTNQAHDEDRLSGEDLEAAYRAMAEDEESEAEALEWIEGTIGDS